jgi:hypothetical protein
MNCPDAPLYKGAMFLSPHIVTHLSPFPGLARAGGREREGAVGFHAG